MEMERDAEEKHMDYSLRLCSAAVIATFPAVGGCSRDSGSVFLSSFLC